jgi:hypothetical protein
LPELKEEEQEHIRMLFTRHIPGTCIDAILQTCAEGVPGYHDYTPFFAKTLRDLFMAFSQSDANGAYGTGHRTQVLNDIVKAHSSPEALRARTIEKYSGEVSGSLFERQIKGFLAEKKEGYLDEVVLELHPDSESTKEEGEQFAHIINAYRQLFGLTGIDYGRSDLYQKDVSDVNARGGRKRYGEQLDIMEIVDSIVKDINQPRGSLNRRFDIKALEEWAKDNLPEPKRIYWDDSRIWLYMQVQHDVLQEESDRSKYPWLDRMQVLEILRRILASSEHY